MEVGGKWGFMIERGERLYKNKSECSGYISHGEMIIIIIIITIIPRAGERDRTMSLLPLTLIFILRTAPTPTEHNAELTLCTQVWILKYQEHLFEGAWRGFRI